MTNPFKRKTSIKNALLLIDIQEKIIRPIFNKDLITKNIKKLMDAYQILDENIFVSEQNPLKLGTTIPELLPKSDFKRIESEGPWRRKQNERIMYFNRIRNFADYF